MSDIKKTQGARKLARAKDYQNVFGSAQGQRVLADLVYRHIVAAGFHPDPYINAHRSGQSDTIKEILKVLKLDIGEIQKRMIAEDTDATETIFDVARRK